MSEPCDGNCGSCGAGCSSEQQEECGPLNPHPMSHVKKIVAVMSGKGGVGKSLVTSLMAVAMNRKGYHAAILDADITGPSIPKLFGLDQKAGASEFGLLPAKSKTGIDILSANLLLENETDPVIWRGPVVAQIVTEFWTDAIWSGVDLLFIDMPPGTGDVPLTVFQSIPVDGIIVVTSPQELVSMIVSKAVRMAEMLSIPILGLVENLAYFECTDCGARHAIFGESHVQETARQHHLKLLAEIPISPKLAAASDEGMIELFEGDWLDTVIGELKQLFADEETLD